MRSIKTTLCLFLAAWLVSTAWPGAAGAVENDSRKPVVAVMEFKQVDGKLSPAQLDILADQLRGMIVEKGVFKTVPFDDIAKAVAQVATKADPECRQDSCRLELGRLTGADKRLDVTIWQGGGKCTIAAVMYSAGTAVTDMSTQVDGGDCNPESLRAGFDQIVAAIGAHHARVGSMKNLVKGVDAISESPIRKCVDCYAASAGGKKAAEKDAGQAQGLCAVEIGEVSVSSGAVDAPASAMTDGKPDTWWLSADGTDAVGQWVELTLAKPAEIRQVRIVSGDRRISGESADIGADRFNRVRKIRIDIAGSTDGGSPSIFMAELQDGPGFQAVDIPAGTRGTTVRVRIMSTYPAATSPAAGPVSRTGIAEIEVLGTM